MPVGFTPVELSGQVVKHITGKGSKSERQATHLSTPEGTYILRRRGGNSYSDPELDKLVGKTIRCKGILTDSTLIISDWNVTGE